MIKESKGKTHVGANALQLHRRNRRDALLRFATVAEKTVQGRSDGLNVVVGDAERRGGEADVLDEPAHLGVVQGHELVRLVQAFVAVVRLDLDGELAAAEQATEELVEMGEEDAKGGSVSVFVVT